jgi:hypothetical protein
LAAIGSAVVACGSGEGVGSGSPSRAQAARSKPAVAAAPFLTNCRRVKGGYGKSIRFWDVLLLFDMGQPSFL